MLTEVAALINIGIGCIWFVGQALFWVFLGGIGGIHYSMKGFAYYSAFLVLLLAGPLCLTLGSWKTYKNRSTAVSTTLNLIGFIVMAYFLVPVVYGALHPLPLEYVDMRFTVVIATVLVLTLVSTCYLSLQYLRDRKQMKKVIVDAA